MNPMRQALSQSCAASKERYENHHKVRIRDEAIIAAVQLSGATSPTVSFLTRLLTSSMRPPLEAQARNRLRCLRRSTISPRQIAQKEIEREAIRREGMDEKVREIERDIAQLREEEKEYSAKWQAERNLISRIQQNKIDIEQLNFRSRQGRT